MIEVLAAAFKEQGFSKRASIPKTVWESQCYVKKELRSGFPFEERNDVSGASDSTNVSAG